MKFLQKISPREYQQRIFETCSKKNCLVILPTGLGKTLVALMLTIKRMQEHPGEKVVFLAPTKPLVEQHINYFKKHLPELFGDMQLFTGAINAKKRKEIWQTADIIFSTPQCVANDLKKNLYDLKEVCLLIEDEVHRCVKNYDYTYIAKKYKFQSKNPRIMGLTASPGSDSKKIKEICQHLSIEDVELRTRESEDVKKYLQEREFEKVHVDFPPELQELKHVFKKLLDYYVEELRYRNVLYGPATKTNIIKTQKNIMTTISRGNKNFGYFHAASAAASALKIQHAAELLETQTLEGLQKYMKDVFKQAADKKSKGVMKLVAKPEFNLIFSTVNELLAKKKEHPKVNKLFEIIQEEKEKNEKFKAIVFTQFRDTATVLSKKINSLNKAKAKVFVGQAKKNGTGLSQKEQKEMIEEFSRGKINVLIATSIAEEGLDIPEVSAVIFYEPISSGIRSIQRAGRTARLEKGKLIMLVTKKTKDETAYYTSRAREKKMQTSIKSVKEHLASGNKFDTQKKLL